MPDHRPQTGKFLVMQVGAGRVCQIAGRAVGNEAVAAAHRNLFGIVRERLLKDNDMGLSIGLAQ